MISQRLCHGTCRLVAVVGLIMAVSSVHGHLMVEQHGTVNFANGGAFLVLSIPVSAFEGVDDNGDDAVSAQELNRHRADVERQIHSGVQLLDDSGNSLPLQGLLMSLTPSDDASDAPAKHLIALGRFPVSTAMSSPGLRIKLLGEAAEEKEFEVTATRDGRSQVMQFTPDRNYHTMFPSSSAISLKE